MSRTSHACAIAAVVLLPVAAFGEDAPGVLEDTFHVEVGTFIVNTDTTLRLDGEAGETGTQIDWEKDFGEGNVTRFRMDGYWRFGERHKLRALVFSSSRDGTRTFDEDIEWGGETFPASAAIEGKMKFSIYELAYEYAFMRRDSYELAASIGVHYTDYEASLGATVTGGGGTVDRHIERKGSVGAPLPVIGVRGTWLLSRTFSIDASGQFFSLTYGDIEGNLQDYRVVVNWQPKSWGGLGVGYDHFSVNVDVDGSNFRGKMKWAYHGPMIFYCVSF